MVKCALLEAWEVLTNVNCCFNWWVDFDTLLPLESVLVDEEHNEVESAVCVYKKNSVISPFGTGVEQERPVLHDRFCREFEWWALSEYERGYLLELWYGRQQPYGLLLRSTEWREWMYPFTFITTKYGQFFLTHVEEVFHGVPKAPFGREISLLRGQYRVVSSEVFPEYVTGLDNLTGVYVQSALTYANKKITNPTPRDF